MDDLNAVIARLEKVEKENRRLKRAGMGGLLIAICGVVMGQASTSHVIQADEVVARKFTLRDTNGKLRGKFEVTNSFGPQLALLDTEGNLRANLYLIDAGNRPYLSLYDPRGNPMVDLAVSSGNLGTRGPSLILRDAEGFSTDIGYANLVTNETGEQPTRSAASVVLFGKDGKVLWSAP